ncbi:integrase catalytic domain-containing protein [Trichonephila clavipes]|nr:integrase catalytic domain-containing protein [Trichonephila clavipes]
MKILGIIWNSKEDTFRINISPPNEVRPTKRQLLSTIAKIYNPLGFLSPTTIQLKILMQDIWKQNISWDDPVTDYIFESWMQFKNQREHLAEIQIPRYLSEDATGKRVLLIGFCAASQHTYATVFYLRTELVTGKVHVSLSMMTSKTRVAPVKSITLPRLELLAALLLSELYVAVLESLRKVIQIDKSFLFSDSQIVLDWLKPLPADGKSLLPIVSYEFKKMTSEASWHHVKSQENPADCASRGIAASKLKIHKLWWSGPQWLNQDSLHFPSIDLSISCEEDVKCEEKSSTVLTNVSTSIQGSYLFEIIAKYSSFSRLIRVIAWCKRFIKNCRSSRVTGVLTSKEVDDATKIVIQTVQESQFHSEIQLLKKKHPLPNSRKLLPQGIFLDTDGIIKVGGRLKNSSLSPIQKHPILLPKSHHLTNLAIQYFHHINLHSGSQLTLCCIRQKFWIPSGRGVVGRLLSKCQTCFRFKAKSGEQLMGNLPANRLSAGRAFLNHSSFAWQQRLCTLRLFRCLFSADAFLAAFWRFISRRGKPTNIFSDNATNFKGASSYLKEQLKLIKSVEVQNFVTQESITWHFIPPTSAHVGGLWEAGIKSTKQLLIKTMKSAVLNFEELVTFVTQIEACLNSRPLTPLSNDPQDLQPLTPGHFSIGAPMASFPEEFPSQPACLKKRWNSIQHLGSQFWRRWHLEYLNQLQQRTKWNKPRRNLKVNDMVLVKENNLPPLQWSLGRVVQVFPGDDGAVRVVDFKTKRG